MFTQKPDFEIRIRGHALVKITNGEIKIDGQDFHTDLKNISALVDILSDVLSSVEEVKKPRLVASEGVLHMPASDVKNFPYKIISNG